MSVRAFVVWCGVLVAAIVNGFVRQTWLVPQMGEGPGHILSTLSLALIVLLVAWATVRWIAPRSDRDAAVLGALWLALTLAFEFLAGHFLFGQPWKRLFEDYNVANGRIWVLVLIATAAALPLAARRRGLTRATPRS